MITRAEAAAGSVPGIIHAHARARWTAKQAAQQRYEHGRRLFGAPLLLPWAGHLLERNAELFHGDWWPYGTQANRHAIDTYLRYHHEQRLSDQRLTIDEVLAPDLLST